MTNHWVDIKNANLIIVMGGNAAEAHPVGFRWAMEAKIHNNAKLIVIDPRFTRTASVADFYTPIRSGTDIAFLSGVLLYLMTNNKFNREYVEAYTNASLLVREDFAFEDGLFSGYDAENRKYDKTTWNYQFDENGFAKRDVTLQDPRCVWNMLKQHVSRYTPDVVTNICGTPKDDFLKVCEYIAETCVADKTASFLYALGWTQHSVGAQNIRTMAMIQLLLGNMGMAGGGVNAARPLQHPGADRSRPAVAEPAGLHDAAVGETDRSRHLPEGQHAEALLPGQVNYWGNYPKFFVSMMKTFYGDKAQKDNSWGFDWLPKWDKGYDVLQYFEMMAQGKVNGYFCQGFNPVASFPNKNKVVASLSKLKFLVTIDPLNTETSNFWQNHGEFNDVDSSQIQTEVFRLPSTCFAEENGSIVNSGRWLQWHWKGADAPGEALNDGEILAGIFSRLREMYARDGGAVPEQVLNMRWDYLTPDNPAPEEVAQENNGKALADLLDADGKVLVKKASCSARSRSCATTAPPPAAAGSSPAAGRRPATRWRGATTPIRPASAIRWAGPGHGRSTAASCTTAPRRTRRVNRGIRNASCWSGTAPSGSGPISRTTAPPRRAATSGRSSCSRKAWAACSPPIRWRKGRSLNTTSRSNAARHQPAAPERGVQPGGARVQGRSGGDGQIRQVPYVGTTYRLTEHFHYWTKHARLNAIAQPEQFVEIGEKLAEKKGIKQGDTVKVSSNRGYIKAKAVVTKRIRTLQVHGQEVDTIGIPIHWGYEGVAKKGFIANTLTPFVGDANTQTPEFKAFLVNVEKV